MAYRAFSSFLLGHLLLEASVRGARTAPAEEPLDEGDSDVPNADQELDVRTTPICSGWSPSCPRTTPMPVRTRAGGPAGPHRPDDHRGVVNPPEPGAHGGSLAAAVHPNEVRGLVDDGEPVTDLGRPGRSPAHQWIGDVAAVVDLDHHMVIGRPDGHQAGSAAVQDGVDRQLVDRDRQVLEPLRRESTRSPNRYATRRTVRGPVIVLTTTISASSGGGVSGRSATPPSRGGRHRRGCRTGHRPGAGSDGCGWPQITNGGRRAAS